MVFDKLLGCPEEIQPDDTGFRWLTSGIGTRYVLITCENGQPHAKSFGTRKASRSHLVERLNTMIADGGECLLLGIESRDVGFAMYRLNPVVARERLAT